MKCGLLLVTAMNSLKLTMDSIKFTSLQPKEVVSIAGASLASMSQLGKRKRFQEKDLIEDAGFPLAEQTRTAKSPRVTLALATLVIFAGSKSGAVKITTQRTNVSSMAW